MEITTKLIKSESLTKLGPAFVAAQAEMPKVGFDSTNPFLHNKYASLGAVIDASRPVLAKFRLSLVQLPTSGEGIAKKEAPTNMAEKNQEPDWQMVKTERQGVEAIGLLSLLLHESGEYLGAECCVTMSSEKGKSMAQMAGSIISYLRRYGWSSICGLYADEDTDGNEPPPSNRGGGRAGGDDSFDNAAPRGGGSQSSTPPRQTATASQPATAGPQIDPDVAKFIHMVAGNRRAWEYCLQNRIVNDKNQVALVGPLESLSVAWAKVFLSNFEQEMAKVEMWCQENPPPATTGNQKPVEVPRDENIDPHSPDAPWRKFPMPWGDKKNTALADLDKKYLFGLWANYNPDSKTSGGKTKTPDQLAADRKFRAMLDEAGKHYDFHVNK